MGRIEIPKLFIHSPDDEIVPGVADWYGSVCSECPAGCGIVELSATMNLAIEVNACPDKPTWDRTPFLTPPAFVFAHVCEYFDADVFAKLDGVSNMWRAQFRRLVANPTHDAGLLPDA